MPRLRVLTYPGLDKSCSVDFPLALRGPGAARGCRHCGLRRPQSRGAGMSDVKDILGLSRDPDGKAKAAPRAKKVQMKKPEGMSREVFALLQQEAEAGRATVPLAPTVRDDGLLKEKRSRMVGWEWQSFNNGGRTDGLRLSHWKKNNDKSTEYTFARFNKTVRRSAITPSTPPCSTNTNPTRTSANTHRW